MAVLRMFCIRDVVVGAYNRPFCMVSRGQAIRSFQDEITRPSDENPMYKHPSDYELYEVATFDDESARFTFPDQPELLMTGANIK